MDKSKHQQGLTSPEHKRGPEISTCPGTCLLPIGREDRTSRKGDNVLAARKCQLCDARIRDTFRISFENPHFRDLSGVQYQVCSRCYTRTLQGLKRYRRQELEKSNKKDMVVV